MRSKVSFCSARLALLVTLLAVGGAVFFTPKSVRAQAETADYTVQFLATWRAETHPDDFPSGAHFSGLIGGTHNDQVRFWETGQLATLGIKNMAEFGSKSALRDEVEAEINGDGSGDAGEVISGGSTISPGFATARFTVSQDHPLATVVTMIAPSPDWFLGVSGLNLFEGGDWANQVVVELLPYDAGTDSGVTFSSSNSATSPPESISRITSAPLAGGVPLGTFTFTRTNPPADTPLFLRADVNSDGGVDISDAIFVLVYLVGGGSEPACLRSADLDGNETINLNDAVMIVRVLLLLSAGDFPAPYPSCGTEVLGTGLGCVMSNCL